MNKVNIILGTVALALSACGNASQDTSAPPAASSQTSVVAEVPAGAPKPVENIAAFKDSVEKAMDDIPPELRERFQMAFNCEIELNKTRPIPREMNAETIRQLTAQLKTGKSPSC